MTRVKASGDPNSKGLWVLLAALLVALLYPWGALHLAHLALGAPKATASPATATIGLLTGQTAWSPAATVMLAALTLATAALAAAALRAAHGGAGKRSRVDALARSLAPARELRGITPKDIAASAARLRGAGTDRKDRDEHGVLLGKTVNGGVELRMDWESTAVAIAGPRVGKTTSLVTPAIAHANLPVVTSSNKADVHDDTRMVREELGRCWVFDPQAIATDGAATFWVDLLAPITNVKAADRLAVHFEAAAGASKTTGGESYFVTEAHNYLSALILAAAAGGGDLLHVCEWSYDPNTEVPRLLLAQGGYHAKAAQLRGITTLTDRQRDGVIGTARSWLSVLDDPRYSAWVIPPQRARFTAEGTTVTRRSTAARTPGSLPLFDPETFVRPTGDGKVGTLYGLSKEGADAATALTTALVGTVFDAGERAAETSPGRRLSTPVLFVLDEAANCVRLRELPDKYSHYGSRGLPVITILQSWSQGEVVWGAEGMNKLWSAANVVWYGGGVKEDAFLQRLANLVGDHDVYRVSTSHACGGGSRSVSSQSERVFSADKLAALPRGRAVILSSGNRAVLARTVPWMEGAKADQIAASKQRWEPS